MQISDELSEQILECSQQIKLKFGINIGYSHPMGSFINEDNDFIIYQTGTVEDDGKRITDVHYGPVYFIEFNQFDYEVEGICCSYNQENMNKKTEAEENFLIDFNSWIKKGIIRVEQFREFIMKSGEIVKWKPVGDGKQYDIKIDHNNGWSTEIIRNLSEIEETEIQEQIQKEFGDGITI